MIGPPTGRLLEEREIVVETVSDDARPEVRASMASWGEKTCLSVPLSFGERPLGMLVLIETQRERDFTADDIELAAGLGEQAAIAIHNARLVESLRVRTEEATLLNDVARAASTSLSVTDIAAAIIEPLRRRLPFDRATLLLRRAGSAVFDVAFSTEAESQLSGISSTDLEAGFLARLKTSSVAVLPLPEQVPLASEHPITGLLCGVVVGIHEDEELIGALVLGSESEAAYSQGDLAVLEGIAAQLSLAVRNARLFENVKRLHLGNLRRSARRSPPRTTTRSATRRAWPPTRCCWPASSAGRTGDRAARGGRLPARHRQDRRSRTASCSRPGRSTERGVGADAAASGRQRRDHRAAARTRSSWPACATTTSATTARGYPDGLAGEEIPVSPGSSASWTPTTRCRRDASTARR